MTRNGMVGRTPERRLTVLVHEWVTGGGLAGEPLPESWAKEGSAMRRAIAGDFLAVDRDRLRVVMTLDGRLGEHSLERGIEIERIGETGGLELVLSLASEADFTVLIAPETGGVLGRLTRDLERLGARTLGSSAEAVELAADKWGCGGWLREMGVRTPATGLLEPSVAVPEGREYPLVIKPVDGAGCVDTFLVTDSSEWPDEASGMGPAIVQRFVEGAAMSASFLADGRGRAWLIGVGEQMVSVRDRRLGYRGGRLPVGEPVVADEVWRAVRSMAGLRGFVGVDFVRDERDGVVTVLEINPRPTTSYVGLCRLLPPGRLASAWLSACGAWSDEGSLERLAALVHSAQPIVFDASGAVEGGAE